MNGMQKLFKEVDAADWCLDKSPTQLPFYADQAARWFYQEHPEASIHELVQFALKLGSRVQVGVTEYDTEYDPAYEKILQELTTNGNNIRATAEKLRCDRKTIRNKLESMPKWLKDKWNYPPSGGGN
jgi:DNA-binding NtrC family response regulator